MNISFVSIDDDPSKEMEEILTRAWQAGEEPLLAVAKAFSDEVPTGVLIKYLLGVCTIVEFVFLGTAGHAFQPNCNVQILGQKVRNAIHPHLVEIVSLMPLRNVEVAGNMAEEGSDVSFLVTLEPDPAEVAALMFATAMAEALGIDL